MSSSRPSQHDRRVVRRLRSRYSDLTVADVTGRLAELVPPADQRCGRASAVGASRVLLGAARGVLGSYRLADVALHGGDATVEVDLRTAHGRRLFGYGFCEPAARVMQSLLKPGDAMIDGGANIGLYTLLAAARVGPHGHVLSCEPSPATMALLRANVDRNQFGCVILREVAVAEEPGRMVIHLFEAGSGFTSFAPADASRASRADVEVVTLDQLAEEIPHPVTVVKLDVEGAEFRALRGATRLLERVRPDFIVEFEPEHLQRQGASAASVQELFEAAEYVAYRIGARATRLGGAWTRPKGDPNILVRPRERSES